MSAISPKFHLGASDLYQWDEMQCARNVQPLAAKPRARKRPGSGPCPCLTWVGDQRLAQPGPKWRRILALAQPGPALTLADNVMADSGQFTRQCSRHMVCFMTNSGIHKLITKYDSCARSVPGDTKTLVDRGCIGEPTLHDSSALRCSEDAGTQTIWAKRDARRAVPKRYATNTFSSDV